MILYHEADKVYAQLKKIDSSSNDFIVDLSINSRNHEDKAVNLRFDANYFFDSWFYIHTLDHVYVTECYNQVKVPIYSFTLQIKVN